MKTTVSGRFHLQLVIALILGLAALLPLPALARADPGDLDPAFGNNGKVITVLGQRSEWANGMIVQADGKILAIGAGQNPDIEIWFEFVLARYNADGTLDVSFGDRGKVATTFGSESAYGEAIALQTDGKVVVAGQIGDNVIDDFLVARYNLDGSLDTSFGADGVVTTDFGRRDASGTAVAIQSDGKIIVGGWTWSSNGNRDFALARYSSDGSLDSTFGNQGTVVTDLGSDEYGMVIAVQADGRIIGGGISGNDAAIVRYDSDGILDPTFGSGGVVTTDLGPWVGGIAIQPDGRIVMAGSAYTSTDDHRGYDIVLARYNTDGSCDGTFGEAGSVTTDFAGGDDYGSDVVIQADGHIVVAGRTETSSGYDFALARHDADGTLDRTFGVAGMVTTDFAGGLDGSSAVAAQVDGKIVVAGWSGSPLSESYDEDFALARYDSDGSLDVGFGVAGMVTSDFELGNSRASDVAVQVDGKTIVAGSVYNGRQMGWDFVLVRYNPDGSLDADFGHDGISTTDFGLGEDNTGGLAIQRDGKIVVAGGAEVEGIERFALARYLYDGSPDPAFGNGGKVTTAFTGSSAAGSAVTIQPDGKIVVAGNSSGFALARYDPNGSLDSSFGSSGTLTITLGSGSFSGAYDMALQSDEKIVVAGTDGLDFALARFNRDGSLDRTFGRDGTLITDFGGNDWCTGLAIQADGKLVAAGDTENGWGFALARYHPDGSLDSAFGTGGVVTTDLGSPVRGGDVAIQPGGKILVAGFVWPPLGEGGGDFALVRYQPDGAPDETFGNGGIVATDFAGGQDVGRAIALQRNGKIVVAGTTTDTFALARFAGWEVFPTYLPVIAQATGQHLGLGR